MPTACPAAPGREHWGPGPPSVEPCRRREAGTASRPPGSCAGTHAWWPRPGLLTQDSAVPGVPGGLAEGAGDTVASRAAVLTVRRRKAASSRGRALTREVCSPIRGGSRAQAQASWSAGPGGTPQVSELPHRTPQSRPEGAPALSTLVELQDGGPGKLKNQVGWQTRGLDPFTPGTLVPIPGCSNPCYSRKPLETGGGTTSPTFLRKKGRIAPAVPVTSSAPDSDSEKPRL